MKNKETMDIWIGFRVTCANLAKLMGHKKCPRIANIPEHLLGYHEKINVYLCGEYRRLPHWNELEVRLYYLTKTSEITFFQLKQVSCFPLDA